MSEPSREILPESQRRESRPGARSTRMLDVAGLVLAAIMMASSAAGMAVSRGAGGVFDTVPVAVIGWIQLVSAAGVSLVILKIFIGRYALTSFEHMAYGMILAGTTLVFVSRLALIVSGSSGPFG